MGVRGLDCLAQNLSRKELLPDLDLEQSDVTKMARQVVPDFAPLTRSTTNNYLIRRTEKILEQGAEAEAPSGPQRPRHTEAER